MSASAPIGEYARIVAERQAILANVSPATRRRILGKREPVQPLPPLVIKPVYLRGRYVPKSVSAIIDLVAEISGLSFGALVGEGHRRSVVHARFAVANLAEEFAPRLSCRAIEDAMNRGDGLCAWYRERHRDRLELYPEYLALYEGCRAVMLRKGAPA